MSGHHHHHHHHHGKTAHAHRHHGHAHPHPQHAHRPAPIAQEHHASGSDPLSKFIGSLFGGGHPASHEAPYVPAPHHRETPHRPFRQPPAPDAYGEPRHAHSGGLAPKIITNDHGGLVTDYQARVETLRAEGRPVEIRGVCNSACTLYLSLPNVRIAPGAKIGFHQAYNSITKERDLGVSAELWNAYPDAVRAQLGQLTPEMRHLSGQQLIAAGFASTRTHHGRH